MQFGSTAVLLACQFGPRELLEILIDKYHCAATDKDKACGWCMARMCNLTHRVLIWALGHEIVLQHPSSIYNRTYVCNYFTGLTTVLHSPMLLLYILLCIILYICVSPTPIQTHIHKSLCSCPGILCIYMWCLCRMGRVQCGMQLPMGICPFWDSWSTSMVAAPVWMRGVM